LSSLPADATLPPPAAPPLQPPAPPQVTRFVAVAGPQHDTDDAASAAGDGSRRSVEERLREAAIDSAAAGGPALVSLSALALGLTSAVILSAAVGRVWALLVLAAHIGVAVLPWLLSDSPTAVRRRWRMHAAIIVACGVALAALPWLPLGANPQVFWLVGLTQATIAMAGAATLAPWTRGAAAAALLPLSTAISAARDAYAIDTLGWVFSAGSGFACAAALLVAASRRRAWRRNARAVIQRDDQIHALVAERDAAQRADEEKSRFLAIASHDLRQPVHALGLFAATLDKRLKGSREEPLVRNMIRSIDGLDRSFNAMLDVSRLDAGTIEPNIQYFPLRDLFRRLHMHFAGQADLRNLGLRFWPGGKAVSSDPQLLERVLGNLVQNAIKYTAEGGVVVVARTTGTHVNVEIWDTGLGIGPAELPRIFDEFYQVGRGERARAQGLGMGLAIVKRLCRLLGHSLSVSSAAGRGTMFRIGIPLTGLSDIQEATAAADTLPQPLAQSRTVVIIDDEGAIREGLRLLLEEWGYVTVTAASIPEVERAVIALGAPPDLILSDLHLGEGPDGIAAIAAIRKQCGHDVPAVVITGDTSQEETQRVIEAGHPMLFKPVQPGKLYSVVRSLVS
jgi:signal transduction histidine kinase/CheY-like chemotaxis protein